MISENQKFQNQSKEEAKENKVQLNFIFDEDSSWANEIWLNRNKDYSFRLGSLTQRVIQHAEQLSKNPRLKTLEFKVSKRNFNEKPFPVSYLKRHAWAVDKKVGLEVKLVGQVYILSFFYNERHLKSV